MVPGSGIPVIIALPFSSILAVNWREDDGISYTTQIKGYIVSIFTYRGLEDGLAGLAARDGGKAVAARD